MEAATSPNVQIAVTQPQQITLQGTTATPQNIQIFEDQSNPGKALYIIDPSQAGGLQVLGADQRFELAGAQTLNRPAATTAAASQPQQSVVVSYFSGLLLI